MPKDYLSVPHHRQSHDGACLPTCVLMVLSYFGFDATETQLAQLMRTRSIGTPARNVRYLNTLGFNTNFGPTTLSQLHENLLNGLPSIVFVSTDALPYHDEAGFHAVVVVGLTEEKVYLNDPASDIVPQIVPIEHFMLAWSDFDYLHATISSID
jgi:ABC-type bacteriocin/lantibiotic exporter with double-glycine peptidase domain